MSGVRPRFFGVGPVVPSRLFSAAQDSLWAIRSTHLDAPFAHPAYRWAIDRLRALPFSPAWDAFSPGSLFRGCSRPPRGPLPGESANCAVPDNGLQDPGAGPFLKRNTQGIGGFALPIGRRSWSDTPDVQAAWRDQFHFAGTRVPAVLPFPTGPPTIHICPTIFFFNSVALYGTHETTPPTRVMVQRLPRLSASEIFNGRQHAPGGTADASPVTNQFWRGVPSRSSLTIASGCEYLANPAGGSDECARPGESRKLGGGAPGRLPVSHSALLNGY